MSGDPKSEHTPRWTGWQRAAVALAALLLLTVLGSAVAVAVGGTGRPDPTAGVVPPPHPFRVPAPPPVQFAPAVPGGLNLGAQDAAWVEVEPGERDEVVQFFTRFGKAVRDPKNDLSDVLWYHDLIPPRAVEGFELKMEGSSPQMVPEFFGRAVVRRERTEWRTWDWTKPDVRRVTKQPGGERYEAVVWHTAKDGTRVKRRWTLLDTAAGMSADLRVQPAVPSAGAERFVAVGWEDLHTGVTAWDLAVVESSIGSRSRKTRGVWRFREVFAVHRALDAGKIGDAGKAVENLQRARFEPDQQYAVDLAEARYLLRVGDPDTALDLCEELVREHRTRLAAHLLLAELLLEAEEYERVKEVVAAYTAVAGDDPDALALAAEAHYRLVETDAAVAAFEKALKLDPFQPLALNWKRRTHKGGEGLQPPLVDFTRAPNPSALFDALARGAEADSDWDGLAGIAWNYSQYKPADHRGGTKGILALCKLGRPEEAVKHFRRSMEQLKGKERAKLVRAFASDMAATDKTLDAYAAVSDADAPLAFRLLAEKLAARTEPSAADELAKLLDAREKREPNVADQRFWRGELNRLRQEYAKAAADYRAFLNTKGEYNETLREAARERMVLSLIHAGKADEAIQATRTAVEADPSFLKAVYADEDLGPLLKGEAFRKFREEFPPPEEKKDEWYK